MIMAIDQGTTGSTVVIFDSELNVIAKANNEFPQKFPQPGWVEHNPADIWRSVEKSVSDVKAMVGNICIKAIGITNQRETTVLWDRRTGEVLYNAIVWQCRRTESICAALKQQGLEKKFSDKTGLVLDPYFSGTKIKWLFDNVSGIKKKAENGDVAFGTIDTWLLWRLTGGKIHVTDVSNASRTLLMNLKTQSWDDELLDILDIPSSILPEIRGNAEVYGETSGCGVLPDGIPIAGMAGDQQSALFGQQCYKAGEVKITYGTGCFLLMNTGNNPVKSSHGLLSTVGWKIGSDDIVYALEGSAFVAGAAVQWLRDGLRVIKSAPEIEKLARKVDSSGGVIFVPALAGMGAPHWRADARGLVTGINRGTKLEHIARAVLEGIALQNCDLLSAMQKDVGESLKSVRVDGGAAANDLLMQMQADFLGIDIIRPGLLETTSLGAALLAGLTIGMWNKDIISNFLPEDRIFKPQISDKERNDILEKWNIAVAKA